MNSDLEFISDSNGHTDFCFIDKGKKDNVDVGNKFISKKTNKLYAMKKIKSSIINNQQEYLEVEREIKLLENLNHILFFI